MQSFLSGNPIISSSLKPSKQHFFDYHYKRLDEGLKKRSETFLPIVWSFMTNQQHQHLDTSQTWKVPYKTFFPYLQVDLYQYGNPEYHIWKKKNIWNKLNFLNLIFFPFESDSTKKNYCLVCRKSWIEESNYYYRKAFIKEVESRFAVKGNITLTP